MSDLAITLTEAEQRIVHDALLHFRDVHVDHHETMAALSYPDERGVRVVAVIDGIFDKMPTPPATFPDYYPYKEEASE